jgi:3-isopropylmalate dehydrogenase
MPSYDILVLPGDGVGPEIIAEAVKVLEVISNHSDVQFKITEGLMGGCSIDKHGVALTDEMLDLAKKSDAVLFGAVGGPKW